MKKTQWIQDYTSIKPTEENKEILLKEYETAVKQLESEEKIFTQAITIFSALITILISVLLTNLPKLKEILNPLTNYYQFIIVCFTLFFTYFITVFILGYFAKKQNDITYSLRKIIIIREIMGCSYDLLQTVLPSWTVHGANNPFSIKKIQPYNSFIFWGVFFSTSFVYLLIYLYLLRNYEYLEITLILIAAVSLVLICRNLIVNNTTYLFYVYSILFFGLIITGIRYELWSLYTFSWLSYSVSLGILFIIKLSINNTKIKFLTDTIIIYILSIVFLHFFYNYIDYIKMNKDAFFIYIFGANWLLCYSIFQKKLFDNYESFLFKTGVFLANILNYKLHPNILFAIYKAKLSIAEVYRLEIDLNIIKNIAVQIEDKRFYSRNSGIDFLALTRAVLFKCMKKFSFIDSCITWCSNKFSFKIEAYTKNSGGSTIAQQLFRTLFINEPFYKKVFIRKLLEVYFSFWMISVFSKEEILELYLCSVRYENKVHGVASALEHFFCIDNKKPNTLDKATSFILIERLSVIHSNLYPIKMNDWVTALKNRGVLELSDIKEIYCKYECLLRKGKVVFKEDKDQITFTSLKARWFEE